MALELPPWLTKDVPKSRRTAARTRWLLRVGALYACEDGTLKALSQRIGFHPHTLGTTASIRETISAETAILLERQLGKALFPRELWAPEIFGEGATLKARR